MPRSPGPTPKAGRHTYLAVRWPPLPRVYAVAMSGVPAERVALVAVHSWDIYGAHCAGLTTGWSPRLEGRPVEVFGAADVVADTLDEVISGLVALPAGPA